MHIVVGAMLIAPGFEPLVRIIFGPITGAWSEMRKGLVSTFVGYLMLAIGSAIGFLLAMALALIPSMAIFGLGLAAGDPELALRD